MLVADAALEEVDYVRAVRDERTRIEQAQLTRIAMWSEQGLAPIERRWEELLEKPKPSVNRDAERQWLAAFRQAEAKGTWKPQ